MTIERGDIMNDHQMEAHAGRCDGVSVRSGTSLRTECVIPLYKDFATEYSLDEESCQERRINERRTAQIIEKDVCINL
jgi:hypothetical protein